MNVLGAILATVVPVMFLLLYIFHKDKERPEPTRWLLLAFVFGLISLPVSLLMSLPISSYLIPLVQDIPVIGTTLDAFLTAAIPEELAKLLMLWLLLVKNPYFDEYLDGMVYAVCIGMGFAAFENGIYLWGNIDNWVSVSISRALFSIPGHFLIALVMGYYYSMVAFRKDKHHTYHLVMLFVAPIVAHGIYDALLMSLNVGLLMTIILMFVFLAFMYWLQMLVTRRMQHLLAIDNHIFSKDKSETINENI